MRYRIGEMAEFFGMTKEGVRYLERQGIVRSVREEKNGYRYYSREEITRLKQIRSYRAIGFSLEEAQLMVCETPRAELVDRLNDKLNEIAQKEEQLRRIKRMLHTQRDAAVRLIGRTQCELSVRPAAVFLPRVEDEQGSRAHDDLSQARAIEKEWTLAMPPVLLCTQRDTANQGKRARQYGCVALVQDVETLKLPVPQEAIRIPQCRCVLGTVEAKLGDELDLSPLFDFATERGLTICGDIYAALRMTFLGEDGVRWGMHEVYLPIGEKPC